MFLDKFIFLANSPSSVLFQNNSVREGKLRDAKVKAEILAEQTYNDVTTSPLFDVIGSSVAIFLIFILIVVIIFILFMFLRR